MNDISMENSVRYVQFQSVVDHSFWHKLCQLKLDVDKLEENERDIWGMFLQPDIPSLFVDYMSFNCEVEWKLYSSQFTSLKGLCSCQSKCKFPLIAMPGFLKNFNTSEAFKSCDKNQVLYNCGKTIQNDIVSHRAVQNPTLLMKFILLTFADLKKHDFYYWFSFPASMSFQASYVGERSTLKNLLHESLMIEFFSSHEALPKEQRSVFGVIINKNSVRCVYLSELIKLLNLGEEEKAYLCFLDSSSDLEHPGWPLRNILALLAFHWKDAERIPLKIISFRVGSCFSESPVFNVSIKVTDAEMSKWVGWEKNNRDKLGPRFISLRDSMDPARLADSSSELNLKLMKWRLAPTLDLDIIAKQRVLILGAGTLGCALARNLLCWGVKTITFVDYGTVSYSNPVRQCLYNYTDCLKDKATAAASALKQILPSVNCSGEVLEIPMPGHTTTSVANANRLHSLIESHDAVFLLTDSRESRWLPTLIAASEGKNCITAALGFDTYLIIRHGHRTGIGNDRSVQLGCYFCNDVTAPGNSSSDRTLDQQCTVSRPGVSNIAASLAVELFVSMLQPPTRRVSGQASSSQGIMSKEEEECSLGSVPHSIRGFLSSYSHLLPATSAFSKCIACSPIVLNLYETKREEFLTKVFESNTYLEEVTGLAELHKITEEMQDFLLSDGDIDSENET